jgi:AcrR family transcriptional regulator
MPRDSTETKTRLLDEAERLFAERGVWTVTNREITEAAGQKNVSALNYHFGSRAQLLLAVLERRGVELDRVRGERGAELDAGSPTGDLVYLLVDVYAGSLATAPGRDYVRIVDQLRAGLVDWRRGPASPDRHLQRVLDLLEERPEGKPEERRLRLVAMMMLMTGMTAARAQGITDGQRQDLDHDAFVEALTGMLVGVLGGNGPD